MDRAVAVVASKRIAKWPKEWRTFVLSLPEAEARVLVELVGLLDARPAGEEKRKAAA